MSRKISGKNGTAITFITDKIGKDIHKSTQQKTNFNQEV